MRALIASMQRVDADAGMLLCRMADRRLHRLLGYEDLGGYCRNALGFSTRKARALIAVERARRRTGSHIDTAYRSGALSWHRCLMLLPVLTERARRTHGSSARSGSRHAGSPTRCSGRAWLATRVSRTSPCRLRSAPAWRTGFAPECNSVECRPGETKLPAPLLDAEIRFKAPCSVADLLRCAVLARCRPGEPSWMGLQRLLEHFHAFWSAAPKHRDLVFERDGWRCAVPACSSRRNLHDHHVEFRSRGGGSERDNRVAVCASHHLHGIHKGLLRVRGRASEGFEWELGRRTAAGPLLRVRGSGEIYVQSAVASAAGVFSRTCSSTGSHLA